MISQQRKDILYFYFLLYFARIIVYSLLEIENYSKILFITNII